MTINGNSALRKNLFTGSKEGSSLYWSHPVPDDGSTSIRGVTRIPTGMRADERAALPGFHRLVRRDQIFVEHRDVREIPVPLGVVQSVADHEPIRDL